MPQITIQKFKPSGKFYDEEKKDLLPDEISADGKTALMFKVSDRIKLEYAGWIKDYGFIYITVEDIGYPCLLHSFSAD